MHGPPPELGEKFALNLEMFDILRVFRFFKRRYFLIESDVDHMVFLGIDLDFLRRAVEVPGRKSPPLSFAQVSDKRSQSRCPVDFWDRCEWVSARRFGCI